MPAEPITVLVPGGDPDMGECNVAEGPNLTEVGNLTVAMTGMANEFGAAAGRRVSRFDQLGADSASMWAVALTSPTVNAGMGYRMATEAGSGRTRVEANTPVAPQTQGG